MTPDDPPSKTDVVLGAPAKSPTGRLLVIVGGLNEGRHAAALHAATVKDASLLVLDYGDLEMRTLANEVRFAHLAEGFERGLDTHVQLDDLIASGALIVEDVVAPFVERGRPRGPNLTKTEQRRRMREHTRRGGR